jgi:hypothetical protein
VSEVFLLYPWIRRAGNNLLCVLCTLTCFKSYVDDSGRLLQNLLPSAWFDSKETVPRAQRMEPQIATGKAECGIWAFQTVQALVVGGHVHSARKEGDAHAPDHCRPGCSRQGLRQVRRARNGHKRWPRLFSELLETLCLGRIALKHK